MKSLSFLFVKTVKNWLLQLLKKPSQLIASLFFVLMLAFVIFSGNLGDSTAAGYNDPSILFAGVFAVFAVIFFTILMRGLDSGATFFSMADVNITFNAPIQPKRILLYGLLKQLGSSLLIGLVLLFQYAWLHDMFGLNLLGLVFILLGYGLTIFCGQLGAMCIYSFTSGHDNRRKAVKTVIYAVIAFIILYAGYSAYVSLPDVIGGIVGAANSAAIGAVPVCGWMSMMVKGLITSDYLPVIIGAALSLAFTGGLLLLLNKLQGDFYEDVLASTETAFSAITAKKEGRVQDIPIKNVRLGKLGLNKGRGATAIYHKLALESRRARVFLFDAMSLIFLACTVFFAVIMKDVMEHSEMMYFILFFSVYMMMFSSLGGRWARELIHPYIYMIPQPSFYKLLNLCRSNVLKICLESALLFIIVGIIYKMNPGDILLATLTRAGFGILFMSGHIVSERLLGGLRNKVFIMSLYMIFMLLCCVPSVICLVLLTMSGAAFWVAAALTAAINVPLAALFIFLSRNMLTYAELNNR